MRVSNYELECVMLRVCNISYTVMFALSLLQTKQVGRGTAVVRSFYRCSAVHARMAVQSRVLSGPRPACTGRSGYSQHPHRTAQG